MADHFRSDSAEVGAVADGLARLGARMTEHVPALGAQVAAAAAACGSDPTADHFCGGPDGFVAYWQGWLQSMRTHAEAVQRHADDLAAHAAVFEQADQA